MSPADRSVRIVRQHDDVVQVMRTWDVEGAPDWTPEYKERAIVPRKVVAVWVDGGIHTISVTGPYRLRSGKESAEWGGTGSTNWDPVHRYAVHARTGADGRVVADDAVPDWIPDLIADHHPAPTEETP